ncbi:MAG TPA: orotate phosphoribosyltransferase [Actinomycetaceae bacterium]|nr:orotate phosphoribosyltransferase [Actinomycetaceae bacterium]
MNQFNDSPRAQLAAYVREHAVIHGEVVLASGKTSDHYVDMRRVTLHHAAAPLVGHVMLDLLEEEGMGPAEIDAVGGLTMGADPVATAILHAAASRGLSMDAFVVRKESKAHGLQRQVEGPDVAGRRVVAVEDTSTTGGSLLTAIEALRAAGAHVMGAAVVVDRDTGARQRIEAEGVRYVTALQKADLGLASGA